MYGRKKMVVIVHEPQEKGLFCPHSFWIKTQVCEANKQAKTKSTINTMLKWCFDMKHVNGAKLNMPQYIMLKNKQVFSAPFIAMQMNSWQVHQPRHPTPPHPTLPCPIPCPDPTILINKFFSERIFYFQGSQAAWGLIRYPLPAERRRQLDASLPAQRPCSPCAGDGRRGAGRAAVSS